MAAKQEWVIILPDYPGALDKRMAIRPDHLNNMKPFVSNGTMVLGGASLDEPVTEGGSLKINGSIMMMIAETREQVLAQIEQDVYYKGEVWDKEKIQIIPFKTAFREQL